MSAESQQASNSLSKKILRSEKKRRQILEIATNVFLEYGYRDASMDQVARVAAASKQTIYKYFGDKEELFKSVVSDITSRVDRQIDELVERLLTETQTGVHTAFEVFAHAMAIAVTPPQLLAMRRLIIANVNRFPEIGQTYSQNGPQRIQKTIARGFEELAQRGYLKLDDPAVAAYQFYWLVLAAPINTSMLYGDAYQLSKKEREEYAASGACVFLAAYGLRS